VTLDDDVFAAAVQLAKASGERLGKVLSELVREGLASPQAASPKKAGRRFPTFNVPRDARAIFAARVQSVIDYEGLLLTPLKCCFSM
jgi:hypothetical protein